MNQEVSKRSVLRPCAGHLSGVAHRAAKLLAVHMSDFKAPVAAKS